MIAEEPAVGWRLETVQHARQVGLPSGWRVTFMRHADGRCVAAEAAGLTDAFIAAIRMAVAEGDAS